MTTWWSAADLLSDIFEVKLTIETTDKGRESDEKLRERRVHVHKELSPNVLRRKASKVDFVKAVLSAWSVQVATGQLAYTTDDGCDSFQSLTTAATQQTAPRMYHSRFLSRPLPPTLLRPPIAGISFLVGQLDRSRSRSLSRASASDSFGGIGAEGVAVAWVLLSSGWTAAEGFDRRVIPGPDMVLYCRYLSAGNSARDI